MSIKYKKIILISLLCSASIMTFCDENQSAESELTNNCLEIISQTYQDIVSVTAIHFIQDPIDEDEEVLESKILKEIGQGCYKLILELAKYSKDIVSAEYSIREKIKRAFALSGGFFFIHRFIKNLSNRRKELQKDKTVSK